MKITFNTFLAASLISAIPVLLGIVVFIVFAILAYLAYISVHLTWKETITLMVTLGLVSFTGAVITIIYAGWLAFMISSIVIACIVGLINRVADDGTESEEDKPYQGNSKMDLVKRLSADTNLKSFDSVKTVGDDSQSIFTIFKKD